MAAGGDAGAIRASDSDRSKVQAILNDAFADGRITRDEWEDRATALAGPVTHADLTRLTSDLVRPPVQVNPYRPPVPSQQGTNGMAIAALACGIGQVVGGPFAGIAAIVLGHQARRRIRLTGEQGDGMALTGLILGYVGTVGLLVLIVLALAFFSISGVRHV
jgi:hypothetical protein